MAWQCSEGPWFNSKLGDLQLWGPKLKGLRTGVGFWGRAASPSPARGLGERRKLPSGVWAKPQPPRVLILFVFWDDLSCYGKSCVHCATVSFHSFLSHECENDYYSSGPSGARGNSRFIDPPVSTPLYTKRLSICLCKLRCLYDELLQRDIRRFNYKALLSSRIKIFHRWDKSSSSSSAAAAAAAAASRWRYALQFRVLQTHTS